MIANKLQFGMDRACNPKSVDISATPAIPNVLRNTMRGVKMAHIELTQGKVALVDDDMHWIDAWKWHLRRSGRNLYAAHHIFNNKTRKSKCFYMHRIIAGAKPGDKVDHINGDGLDNRKCNLRICTNSENMQNMHRLKRNKTSQYKGVSRHRKSKKWTARIRLNYKLHYIGSFASEKEAARAYNTKASELFKQFARLNPVGEC